MIDVRALRVEEFDRAVDVLVPALRDAPLNEWMLGEWAGDEVAQRWLTELQLIEPLRAGYVLGGFDGPELVGVLAWSPPESYEPQPEPEFLQRSTEVLAQRPQLRERLAEFHRTSIENRYPEPHVALTLGGLIARVRGAKLMGTLVEPVLKAADAASVGTWMATATHSVGMSVIGRHGGAQIGDYQVGPVRMLTFFRPFGG